MTSPRTTPITDNAKPDSGQGLKDALTSVTNADADAAATLADLSVQGEQVATISKAAKAAKQAHASAWKAIDAIESGLFALWGKLSKAKPSEAAAAARNSTQVIEARLNAEPPQPVVKDVTADANDNAKRGDDADELAKAIGILTAKVDDIEKLLAEQNKALHGAVTEVDDADAEAKDLIRAIRGLN
jgi:hypothetical protein